MRLWISVTLRVVLGRAMDLTAEASTGRFSLPTLDWSAGLGAAVEGENDLSSSRSLAVMALAFTCPGPDAKT